MTAAQMVGYSLSHTTALTVIVSTRIYHGTRPVGTVVPCINYFEVSGGQRSKGMEMVTYSINCRASTPAIALQIARLVTDLFHGTSSMGTYGDSNGFGVARASLVQNQGLIPEPGDNMVNAPVDILFVYPTASVT